MDFLRLRFFFVLCSGTPAVDFRFSFLLAALVVPFVGAAGVAVMEKLVSSQRSQAIRQDTGSIELVRNARVTRRACISIFGVRREGRGEIGRVTQTQNAAE